MLESKPEMFGGRRTLKRFLAWNEDPVDYASRTSPGQLGFTLLLLCELCALVRP